MVQAWVSLDPRARWLFHLQSLLRLVLFWVPVSVVACVVLCGFVSMFTAVTVVAVWLFVQFLLAVWLPTFAFERWGYVVRDSDLLVTHGVFFREVVALPTARIQHVDMRQGPLEQWMGLARIQVYTASGMGSDAVIPGLDIDVADALRDRLAQVSGDDGV